MKEHEASCPRAQAWDHGEYEAPCTCEPMTDAQAVETLRARLGALKEQPVYEPGARDSYRMALALAEDALALLVHEREQVRQVWEQAAQVADDEAHGNSMAAAAIGLGGSTRAHAIMSARSDTARQIAAALRARGEKGGENG